MAETVSHEVAIIGAGVAGLNAACELRARGTKDYLILEAGEHVGGRVKTVETSSGNIVNQGAHWVHPIEGSVENNPVMDDLAGYDLPGIIDGNRQLDIIFDDGVERKVSFRDKMLSEVSRLAEHFYPGVEHKNIAFEDLVERLNNPRYSALAHYLRHNWMAATDRAHCSLADIESDPHSSGGQIVEGGMSEYTRALAEEAGDEHIRTRSEIVSIEETPDEVIMRDKEGNRYLARYAILTPSVGVLQSGDIEMKGALKGALDEKVRGYHMGEMFKMTFELPREVFEKQKHRTNRRFVVLPGDRKPALCITGNADNPTLTILCGGEVAYAMERATPADQIEYARSIVARVPSLRDVMGEINRAPIVTDWSRNPYTRGCYSTKELGFKGHDEPQWISPRVLLAGEAFHPYVGYLDSAAISGTQAGEKVAAKLTAPSIAIGA